MSYKFKQGDHLVHKNGKVRYKIMFQSVDCDGNNTYVMVRETKSKGLITVTLPAETVEKFYTTYTPMPVKGLDQMDTDCDFSQGIQEFDQERESLDTEKMWERHKDFLGG